MSGAPVKNGFWADRKARVRAEAEAEELAAAAEADQASRAAQEQKTDEELLEEFGLPDPDTLKIGDDVKGFMSKAVPDRLRRRALRRLWTLDPVLANVDGLVDYGQDFTDSAMTVENLQTAYQVGKGMLGHVQEMAKQAEEKLTALEDPKQPETETPAEVVDQSAADAHDMPEAEDAVTETAASSLVNEVDHTDALDDGPEFTTPPRRRMRFHYSNPEPSEAVT